MNPFEIFVERYDRWFETDYGRKAFEIELSCLSQIIQKSQRSLEVGVGTGRFAEKLGIDYGIDIAPSPLKKARGRGIKVVLGRAENLPFKKDSLEVVALIVTLCFVENPGKVLEECWRVLRPEGKLILGVIPRESPLAEYYIKKAKAGHAFYSMARFYSEGEIDSMLHPFRLERTLRVNIPAHGEIPEGYFLCKLASKPRASSSIK